MTGRVIIADDHEVIRTMLTRNLEKEGLEVRTAATSIEVLDLVENFVPDIMFIDLVMPDISGDRLCKIIRNMPFMRDVYIVILSAVALEESIDFVSCGANACIAKGPFSTLGTHVRHVLRERKSEGSLLTANEIIGIDDVHERNVVKELLAIRKRYEVILDNMAEGILEVTGGGKIIYANPGALSLVGASEESLLGSDIEKIFDASHVAIVEEMLEFVTAGRVMAASGTIVRMGDRHVSLTGYPLKGGSAGGVVMILHDVTQQKEFEAQLLQAQKMEAIGTLAGGIAHDFNNILVAILGYAELALLETPKEGSLHETLLGIKQAGQRAKELVSQILSFSRKSEIEKRLVQLNFIATDVVKLLRATVPSSLHFKLQMPEAPVFIIADPVQMQQVLMNLCTNGAHSMQPGGGILTVAIEIMDVPGEIDKTPVGLARGKYAVLSVQDTGHGMSREVMARIFEPFYTTKGLGQGTGMGLSVVHGIVNNHGGAIDVNSVTGKGSVFRVFLPLAKQNDDDDTTLRDSPLLPRGNECLLLVDDENDALAVGQQILKYLGYTVETAKNATEALMRFRDNPDKFDIVVTDLTMPGMNGLELAKQLSDMRPGLPILLTSGYNENVSNETLKEAGIRNFALKPLTMEELAVLVRQALER